MAHQEPLDCSQDPKKTLNNTLAPKVTQNSPLAPGKSKEADEEEREAFEESDDIQVMDEEL